MTQSLNVLRQMRAAGTAPLVDEFQRTALGWHWIAAAGTLSAIHDNGAGKPRGVAAYAGMGSARAAVHWYAPVIGDSINCFVSLYFPPFTADVGVTNVLVCADQQLTSYIAAQFDASITEGWVTVRLCHGLGGPYSESMIPHGQARGEVGEYEDFRIVYDNTDRTASVFHRRNDAGMTEPIVSWRDSDGVVPHGNGYTYTGFSWQGDTLTTGPQITRWELR